MFIFSLHKCEYRMSGEKRILNLEILRSIQNLVLLFFCFSLECRIEPFLRINTFDMDNIHKFDNLIYLSPKISGKNGREFRMRNNKKTLFDQKFNER